MGKFKVGDKVRKRDGDDHPYLLTGFVYEIAKIDRFLGEDFIQLEGFHGTAFSEYRFLPNKPKFKGNN